MIGTNHHFETGFIDRIPFLLRPAAMDLLKFYRLKQLIEMCQTQPTIEFTRRFNLANEQQQMVLKAAILTKISYFTITPNLPLSYMNKLLQIIAYALDMQGASLADLYKKVEQDYSFFAVWLKQVNHAKLIKKKLRKL